MAYKWLIRIYHEPALWLVLAALFLVQSVSFMAEGNGIWGALCCAVSMHCGFKVLREINRLRRRVNYLISAAMSGDFSYKFPTIGIPDHERDINQTLNRLVEHLEKLSHDARENEAFLSYIINLVDIGIVVANEKGHVTHANRASLAILSVPVLTDMCQIPDELAGMKISRSMARLKDESITIVTISDLRRPLQFAEVQSWERLTRVLTHEIMNSLTPINSIAESLGKLYLTDDIKPQLDVISSSSRNLMEFVKNFRKFTKLPEPQPTIFYIKGMIERVVGLASSYPNAAGADFRVMVFPPDAMLYTDEGMLSQVILNIIKNALEANADSIDVSAEVKEDESIAITISNNGERIPDEIAKQIFTPFFTTKTDGSGVGLSLSRRIISTLGGSLTLVAEPSTKFVIVI